MSATLFLFTAISVSPRSFLTHAQSSNELSVATRITLGAASALPASTFCVAIHLESVASTRNIAVTRRDVRRRIIFEGIMCFAIPLVLMALRKFSVLVLFAHSNIQWVDFVVQDHRFDILEDYGCQAATYVSIPAVFIVWLPPLTFSCGTLIFSGGCLPFLVS